MRNIESVVRTISMRPLQAELETQSNMNKRRGIAAEKREARLEREEAERYQQQRDELVRLSLRRDCSSSCFPNKLT